MKSSIIFIIIINIIQKSLEIYQDLNMLNDMNIINFNVEVDICPFIKYSNTCTFISTDNLAVLYNIKYGLQNLYSVQQLINCDLSEKDEKNLKKKNDNFQENLIKHFILIRFYCLTMMKKEKLFSQEFLDNGVNIFEQYTLKSLENQSNKNFEIIMIIHNEIDLNHKSIQKLYKIKSSLKINIIRYNEITSFIEANSKNQKYLITTRIDHDDLIYNGAVEEIQNKCNENIPLFYNGYDKLITMIKNDIYNSYKFYPNYKGLGSISIFQSLIVNKEKINQLYNIFQLGGHSKLKGTFIKLYKKHNLEFKEEYFNLNHLEDCCIYIKHEFNHSSHIKPRHKKKGHRTNIKIRKDKKWFIERFGKFI